MSAPLIAITLPSGVIVQYKVPSPLDAMKARAAWQRAGGEASGASVFHAYYAWGVHMIGSMEFSLDRADVWEPLEHMPTEQDNAAVVSVISVLMSTTQDQVDAVLKSLRRLDAPAPETAPLSEEGGAAFNGSGNGAVELEVV